MIDKRTYPGRRTGLAGLMRPRRLRHRRAGARRDQRWDRDRRRPAARGRAPTASSRSAATTPTATASAPVATTRARTSWPSAASRSSPRRPGGSSWSTTTPPPATTWSSTGSASAPDIAYMHLTEPRRRSASARPVEAGEQLGTVGRTGNASACHLHFEMWSAPGYYSGGSVIDPLPYLKRWDRASSRARPERPPCRARRPRARPAACSGSAGRRRPSCRRSPR